MYCQRCGSEVADGTKFCGKCGGNQFIDKPIDFKPTMNGNTDSVNNVSASNANNLIDPDEQIIATLGNGYGVNLLYGNAKKCQAILTDKRLYLNGALYTGNGNVLDKVTMHQVIDIEDITGTGFIYSRLSKLMIIAGILTLPTIIIGIILLAKAFLDRKTFFFIQYAGGSINFDANIVGLADVSDFHKQIRRVKDKMKNN